MCLKDLVEHIAILPTEPHHWIWTGATGPGNKPVLNGERTVALIPDNDEWDATTSVAKTVYSLTHPRASCVKLTKECEDPLCVNPSHFKNVLP